MHAYLSHSYRDVAINGYFLKHFVEEEIPLRADQKTDVWCIAKLERYMNETDGFISIITRRASETDAGGYSPYIGQELSLARRARVPRLLFLDQEVYKHHRVDFPEDAVLFHPEALGDDRGPYGAAIRNFRKKLEVSLRAPLPARPAQASVVVSESRALAGVGQDVSEILRQEGFTPALVSGRGAERGLDDIRLLEALWRSELCVFILGERLSQAHIALAMAHAHGIPSVRLQYDHRAKDCNPGVTGVIRWSAARDVLVEFSNQLSSYRKGLVHPVERALDSSPTQAAQDMAIMEWRRLDENRWSIEDGQALLAHVHPDHSFVRDEVGRARAEANKALGLMEGREGSMEVCRLLYEGLRRRRYGYEIEQRSAIPGTQDIRTPNQIMTHKTATCIDVACLFGSLLEGAGQNPLVVVLEGEGFAHALAGYRPRGEPPLDSPGLSDLRGAVRRGDAVVFEATGAVESTDAVGAETRQERVEKLLGFGDAISAANRLLIMEGITLKHFIDVRMLREGGSVSRGR